MIDKDGNQLKAEDLHPFLIDDNGLVHFFMKITEKTDIFINFEVYEAVSQAVAAECGLKMSWAA